MNAATMAGACPCVVVEKLGTARSVCGGHNGAYTNIQIGDTQIQAAGRIRARDRVHGCRIPARLSGMQVPTMDVRGRTPVLCRILFGMLVVACSWPARPAESAPPKETNRFEREQGRMMLDVVKNDLELYYYDPTFHGLPLDELFGRAMARIAEARAQVDINAAIAEALLALDDSHTYFVPPGWAAKIEYGWFTQMIGDRCHLMAVQPGSEAESMGLKKGDRVLAIDGEAPSRESLPTMMYDQRLLAPRARSTLRLQPPGGAEREVTVRPKVTTRQRRITIMDRSIIYRELEDQAYLDRHRLASFGDDLVVWKMSQFNLTREEVGRIVAKVRKHHHLILDLRGNPGGAVETLEYMVGAFLGEKVTIGAVNSRESRKPVVSRKAPERFEGDLVVLVDSESASAAELFARAMQIAGRARILGDLTAGRVMMSRFYDRKIGLGTTMFYGTSITIADIIMTDGKSLEKTGVTPDEVLLPVAEDLASDHDPVLSRAAALCGVTLDPAKAGALFPFEWKR